MRRTRVSPNHPSLHRIAASRTLHLIDVDNLIGDPQCTESDVIRRTYEEYRLAASFNQGDQAVVATGRNTQHVFAVESAWPTARHVRRGGFDGADMALLEEAEWAARFCRFRRVVIGSGDRIFLDAITRLRAADITVDFVSRREALATAIATRAHGHIHFLPEVARADAA